MSLIWAAGNKTTAITNIKDAINTRITEQPDGSKALDTASLKLWIETELKDMIADSEVENLTMAQDAISNADITSPVNRLANFVGRDNWASDPRWPKLAVVGSDAFVSAVIDAQAKMKTLVSDLEAEYASIKEDLPAYLSRYYFDNQINTLIPDAVTRIVDSRFYIVTFVTDWDEESAPSPVSARFDADQNDYVTITRPTVPSGRNIVGWRLYRTNVGSSGAEFQMVAKTVNKTAGVDDALVLTAVSGSTTLFKSQIGAVTDAGGNFKYYDIATTTLVDDEPSSELQEVCPSTTWLEPPRRESGSNPYLKGMTAMPNGVMAGFYDNVVAFCESYIPYGWPAEYQMNTEYPIVSIASFGQTLVVGTQGGIDYISGADAASMSQQRNVSRQACVSAKSMITVEGGVVFASPDGLCLATNNGVQVVTENHFTRTDWQALNPSSMICAYHEATVYFFGGAITGAYALHLGTGKLTTIPEAGTAAYEDRLTDRLYFVRGTNIVQVFGGTTPRTGTWRSKIAVLPKQEPFAWLAVESDFTHPVTVKWIGDGTLRYTAVVNSRSPVRLPAGRYLEHELEVSSQGRWNKITLASSGDELRQA